MYLQIVPSLIESVRPTLLSIGETTSILASLVPLNQFWRWKEMWSNSLRTAIFCAVLIEYLTNGTLMTLARVSETLGSKEPPFVNWILHQNFNSLRQSRKNGKIASLSPQRIICTA